MVTVHTGAETIQGRKLFKGGKYMRKYGKSKGYMQFVLFSTAEISLNVVAFSECINFNWVQQQTHPKVKTVKLNGLDITNHNK